MRYFRNNKAQIVIREDDNGNRYIKRFDIVMHQPTDEIIVSPEDRTAYGEVGLGQQFPLTEINKYWYDDFGIKWRFEDNGTYSSLILDRKYYTQKFIDEHKEEDEIYNDGDPYDDIYEILGDV